MHSKPVCRLAGSKPYIMRKFILLFSVLILGTTGILANSIDDKVAERNAYRYNNNRSFIFVENGITFSVYPDGEFDFYIDNRIGNRRRNITFNSGFDYSPFAQYDDYGAVIQVENVPVYYDHFGRATQIGDVNINYFNNKVSAVGNMFVYYNRRGFYDYHTGFINIYNRHYVYSPFHGFFARPSIGFSLVFGRPYRRFYTPIRYTYFNPYRYNTRRTYATIGETHRYNRVRRERSSVYRNDRRVARNNSTRSNRTAARRNTAGRTNRTAIANNTARTNNRGRSTTRTKTVRNSNIRKGTTNGRTVTKRKVARTTRNTTVKRSATTYRKPVSGSNSRTVRSATKNRTQRTIARPAQRVTRNTGVSQRSRSQKSVQKAPSRSRSVTTRSSSSRSVRKAPVRSSRSVASRSSRSNGRATTSRSVGRQ